MGKLWELESHVQVFDFSLCLRQKDACNESALGLGICVCTLFDFTLPIGTGLQFTEQIECAVTDASVVEQV